MLLDETSGLAWESSMFTLYATLSLISECCVLLRVMDPELENPVVEVQLVLVFVLVPELELKLDMELSLPVELAPLKVELISSEPDPNTLIPSDEKSSVSERFEKFENEREELAMAQNMYIFAFGTTRSFSTG